MLLKKRFYFVRHGQTDWNKMCMCQGHTDIPLNETGRFEAEKLGEKIGNYPFDRIYASPLKRAHETAEILNKAVPHLSIHLLSDLKERYYGQLEGSPSQNMYQLEIDEEQNPHFFHTKGVEPRADFKKRLVNGINQTLEKSNSPLLVSHGRVFLALCEIVNIPPIRQIPNTAFFLFEPKEQGWDVQLL